MGTKSGDDPKTLRETFLNQKDFITLSSDSDVTEEYKKDRDHWWIHFVDTRTQFPIPQKPKYVDNTSRGMGSSQLLDGITEHGQGTIGNKNGMELEEHTDFLNQGLMVIQNSRWGEITRRIFEV